MKMQGMKMPFYEIETWEEAERLLPAEDYGPPFWLDMAASVITARRAATYARNRGLEMWFNRSDPLYDRVRLR